MPALGNANNHASVWTQDGRSKLLDLPATSVEWERTLCGISRATAVVRSVDCEKRFAEIQPWAHTLVVHRGTDRVWEGPIGDITDSPDALTIPASDVLGWTERRPVRTARAVTASPVVTELNASITSAFASHDPNVLAYRQTLAGPSGTDFGPNVAREVAAWSAYHDDDMGSLVALGARFTVLGRSILAWAETVTIGRTPTLVPERHLLTGVTIRLAASQLATEVVARDDQGHASAYRGAGLPPLADPFYGHVGVLAGVGGDQKPPALARAATSIRDQSYPLPYVVEVPGDAALSCDAPFPMTQLVPGSLVPLETTTATGRRVSATFVLASVKVNQSRNADEKVAITLAPLTEAVA
jgi:hypothetical protein